MKPAPSTESKAPRVSPFFDPATNTVSYIVTDRSTQRCAIIDSVLDFDQAAGRTTTQSADRLIAHVRKHDLEVDWIIDTHVHADHLSAAFYLQQQLGGQTAISKRVSQIQQVFGAIFNEGDDFHTDGRQFDYLFADNETYQLGELQATAIYTPGHTPACMAHHIGDAVFVGDTLFMPDYGTARCDFPGGDAQQLYQSIQTLFELADSTRVFVCHDYLPDGREEYAWQSTIGEQRLHNIHVHQGVAQAQFVAMRAIRDASLGMPALILPSVQINMRAGALPEPQANGTSYLKLPLNLL